MDATRLLLQGRGTFRAVFSSWRAGRGGASYKLLQIIDLKLTACPPTHPQAQGPVLPLKRGERRVLPEPPDPEGQGGERCPPGSGPLALPLSSPADSAPWAAARGCAQLLRWVLYAWSDANLDKPAHLVNTLRVLEDVIRPVRICGDVHSTGTCSQQSNNLPKIFHLSNQCPVPSATSRAGGQPAAAAPGSCRPAAHPAEGHAAGTCPPAAGRYVCLSPSYLSPGTHRLVGKSQTLRSHLRLCKKSGSESCLLTLQRVKCCVLPLTASYSLAVG